MADITIADITSGAIDGTGIFDEIMRGLTVRLDAQFALNRIKGPEYANVYISSVRVAMEQAITFALQEQTSDKQAELLTAQIAETIDATNRANDQLQDQLATAAKQREQICEAILLTQAQTAEVLADTIRRDLQAAKELELADKELALKDLQMADITQGIDVKIAQEAEILDGTVRANTTLTDTLLTTLAQRTQLTAQTALTGTQEAEVLDSTARANTTLTDTLLTTVLERSELTAKVSMIGSQEAEIVDSTVRANTALNDQLTSAEKDREKADSAIVLLNAQTNEQLDSTTRANTGLQDSLLSSSIGRDKTLSDIELNQMQIAEQVDATTRANTDLSDRLVSTEKQREELEAKINLTTVQTAEIVADTDRKDGLYVKDLLIKDGQYGKLTAEEVLLTQKNATEVNTTTLVLKQQDLYVAQTDGFARDAEQKAAKLWVDVWTVARTTDEATFSPFTITADDSGQINKLVKDLATKAGLDYTT